MLNVVNSGFKGVGKDCEENYNLFLKMYLEKWYAIILIVKYQVEVLCMITRIFILDDSLVFEKMIEDILEESRNLLIPWNFEIIKGLN